MLVRVPTSPAPTDALPATTDALPVPADALLLLQRTRAELSRALLAWAGGSVLLGAPLWLLGRRIRSRLAVGVGRQALAWGAIDLVIAVAGRLADRRAVADPPAGVRSLRRLLVLNAWLDIGYLVAAVVFRRRIGADAVGVGVQAIALLLIDTVHAGRLGRLGRR